MGGEYQEIYSGTNFSGPVLIQDVAFASSSRSDVGPSTYDVTIGLSTTSASSSVFGSASPNSAANKGADFTQVFSGTLTANLTANNTFDLVFPTTPFVFNPSGGNLLFDVVINGATTSPGFSLFDTAQNQERIYQSFGQGSGYVDTEGLYTQFTVTPAAVPEASTTVSLGLLLALGLGGVVVAAKKKRAIRA